MALGRTCAVLGATGLVGSALLDLLLADLREGRYTAVTAIGRRAPGRMQAGFEALVTDLDTPATFRDRLAVDDIYSCLGTTIGQAGSREAFRRIDLEIPLAVASVGREAGVKRCLLVSAAGADPGSAIFYNRVKGDAELGLSALAFPEGVKILRPSLLLGERKTPRAGERAAAWVMKGVSPLLRGKLARYRAIDASDVARALRNAALFEPGGTRVYEGSALMALARRG